MGVKEAVIYLAAGGAGAVLAQILFSTVRARRRRARTQSLSLQQLPSPTVPDSIPEELEAELFSRNFNFFGEEGFKVIRESLVLVVGLGGVGSHAAHMLARGGVKHLRVVDFDQVTLSSLNRHAVATWSDVGTSKAEALSRHLKSIVPGIKIDVRVQMFTAEVADEILSGSPSYVLDCIDDVGTKCQLLEACARKGLPVMSSMGAAQKVDPTRIRMGTLCDAVRDPLACKIRWRMKKYDLDPEAIHCVFIASNPVGGLMPLTAEQAANPEDFGTVEHFRLRTLPVLGTAPALFGQSMATWVLCEIGGKNFTPLAMVPLARAMRHKLLQHLKRREQKLFPGTWMELDMSDIDYIVDLWRGRCPVTNTRMVGSGTMELMRWDPKRPLAPNNCVLLSTKTVGHVDREGREAAIPPEAAVFIETVLRSQGSDW